VNDVYPTFPVSQEAQITLCGWQAGRLASLAATASCAGEPGLVARIDSSTVLCPTMPKKMPKRSWDYCWHHYEQSLNANRSLDYLQSLTKCVWCVQLVCEQSRNHRQTESRWLGTRSCPRKPLSLQAPFKTWQSDCSAPKARSTNWNVAQYLSSSRLVLVREKVRPYALSSRCP